MLETGREICGNTSFYTTAFRFVSLYVVPHALSTPSLWSSKAIITPDVTLFQDVYYWSMTAGNIGDQMGKQVSETYWGYKLVSKTYWGYKLVSETY